MPDAIAAAFAAARAAGRTALMPYLTGGFPDRDETPDLIAALVRGGAAMVELGVPFSDPTADGTAVQRAGQRALANGVTLADCLQIARESHARTGVPIILMGYCNPFWQYGLDRLCREAAASGVAGFIVPDLPPEEADELRAVAREHGLALVYMAALTSAPERLALVGRQSSGFVYCVTVRGVTGARSELPAELPAFFARVREHTPLPLAAGFGISTPELVRAVGQHVDGAAIGSALVSLLERTPREERTGAAEAFMRELGRGAVREAAATGR